MIGHHVKRALLAQRFADFTAFCADQRARIEHDLARPHPQRTVDDDYPMYPDNIWRRAGVAQLPREEYDVVSR